LKIKLNGDNIKWDVDRVVRIDRTAAEAQAARGCKTWCYSADFNEKCANVDYVPIFWPKWASVPPPRSSGSNISSSPRIATFAPIPKTACTARQDQPVVIDESLVDFESLLLSRELGYSAVALKACKGHSEALLMGAAAQKSRCSLCVQDLTWPGLFVPPLGQPFGADSDHPPPSKQRPAVIARRHAGWADRFPSMFHVTDGTLGTAVLNGLDSDSETCPQIGPLALWRGFRARGKATKTRVLI